VSVNRPGQHDNAKKKGAQAAGIGCLGVLGIIILIVLLAMCSTMATNSTKPTAPDSANAPAPPAPAPGNGPLPTLPALPPEMARQCNFADCDAGTAVVTATKKDGPFFSCETEALADYTNFVLGLVSLGGKVRNIDPETREPQYEGATKTMLDQLRSKAGVATFDEAGSHCRLGPYRHRVIVMNYQKDRQSTWVADTASKSSFWLPTNEIERIQK